MNSSAASVMVLRRVGPLARFLPPEGDTTLVHSHKPAIGDRHPMSITRQIAQHGGRSGERAFGVDDPLAPTQRLEPILKRLVRCQRLVFNQELQLPVAMRLSELLKEQPVEQS